MFNFSYKTAGRVTAAFFLALLSLNVIIDQTDRERDIVSKFLLTNVHQPKPKTMPRLLSAKGQGLPFLSENSILRGDTELDVHLSIGQNSKILLTENRTYSLGEEIKLTIILYNDRGEEILRGGDYLRLWLENVKVKAAVSGKVMDNDDGTYSGTVRATWSGEAVIGVMILGRREEIALMYQMYNKYHTLWYNYAEFTNGVTVENTDCSVSPYDKNQKWCNLTAENAGFPWFCIQPKNPELSCSMWERIWSDNKPRKMDGLSNLWGQSNEKDLLPRALLGINGTSGRITSPETPCNKISSEGTWNKKSPQGFFYKDQWHSTLCTDSMEHTPTAYKECLRGRTLYLHGDSTSGQFIDYLTGILGLKMKGINHHPKIRSDTEYNFTLSWYAHELPFYHGMVHYNKSVNLAQQIILDKIPSNSRDIIVLYLYVHFTLNHPSVFKQHVQRLVQSVRKLISRAPGVTIAVRGPHAFMKMRSIPLLHSYWGLHFMTILYEEFESLRKNVLYLDYWDMTMANIPRNMHPQRKTITDMVQYMMSLVCHRK